MASGQASNAPQVDINLTEVLQDALPSHKHTDILKILNVLYQSTPTVIGPEVGSEKSMSFAVCAKEFAQTLLTKFFQGMFENADSWTGENLETKIFCDLLEPAQDMVIVTGAASGGEKEGAVAIIAKYIGGENTAI